MSILEVPIRVINPFWEMFPGCHLRKINPLHRIQIVLLNTFFRNRLRSLWLRSTFSTVEQMISITNWIIKRAKTKMPVLNMMFHSNELASGASPYNNTEADVDNFVGRLRKYFGALFSSYDVQSIGLSDAIEVI